MCVYVTELGDVAGASPFSILSCLPCSKPRSTADAYTDESEAGRQKDRTRFWRLMVVYTAFYLYSKSPVLLNSRAGWQLQVK